MSSTLFSLVSMVVLFLSLSSCSARDEPDFPTQSRINHVCSQTVDYFLCRDIFNNHLFNRVTDFVGLTQIALDQSLIYATDTIVLIGNLKRNESQETQRQLLEICSTGYNLLVDEFTNATFAFGKRDYSSMLFDIEKCDRFVDDCEEVLGNKITVVHNNNVHMKVLVKMSYASGELIGSELTK